MKIPKGMPDWVFWRESLVCWGCGEEVHPSSLGFYKEVVDAPGALMHYCSDGVYTEIDPTTVSPFLKIIACRFRGCDAARPADDPNDWHATGRLFALETGRIYGQGEFCPRHRKKGGRRSPLKKRWKKTPRARKASGKKAAGKASR